MLLSSPACRHSNIPLAQEAFSFQSGRSELKLKPSHLCFSYSSCREHAWKGLRELRRSSKRRGGLLRQGPSTRASSISTKDKLSSIGETGKEEAMTEEETGVVIVGAGLAGLSAARQLARANVPFLLVEASDGVGGRVRTDSFRGFQLDRGFQLLLSGYPETREVLDYDALKLQNFYAGALVKLDSGFHRVADPLKHPVGGILSLFNPVGTLLDKILVGLVRYRATKKSVDEILSAEEVSTLERLRSEGFSTSMIDKFFRPFFGGVFFDKELATTSRLFEFIFRAFALGDNALPAGGMGAISQQLADALPQASIRLNSKVEALLLGGSSPGVKLRSGAIIKSKHGVVVAVEGPEAARLLGTSLDTAVTARPPRQSLTVYFSADKPPHPEPILFLNGSGKGIVNSLVVISNVAPSYAPPGKSLISASVVPRSLDRDDVAGLEQVVRRELEDWFGAAEVAKWEHLRTDTIVYGQPDQTLPTDLAREVRLGAGLYVCGDHRDHATTHGALVSGKRAAQALMADAKVIQ